MVVLRLDDALRLEAAAREKAERERDYLKSRYEFWADLADRRDRELSALQEKVKGVPHWGPSTANPLIWLPVDGKPPFSLILHTQKVCAANGGACLFLEPETPEPSSSTPAKEGHHHEQSTDS